MARREQGVAAETLEGIESAADRLGDWLQENLRIVVVVVAVTLLAAGIASWIATSNQAAEEEASAALSQTRDAYLSAMGAAPGTLDVPELANPAAAAQIRAEYEQRFGEVAAEHPGTVAGTLATLERARLVAEGGDNEQALALLESALDDAPSGPVRGMVLQRLAQRLEVAGRWEEAAARHEQAAEQGDFPLSGWALADAARCRAEAGDTAAALALYERLEREHPELRLPDAHRTRMLELRAAAGNAAGGTPAAATGTASATP